MATAVQIELMVDEKGAVSGIRSFDTAIKSTKANVVQLNSELARTNVASAAGAGGSLKSLEKEFTGGESSLRTMNAEVRSLQGSIYGDSRAAAEFLAIFPKIGAAMEVAFPLFGAVALIGVLVQAGEKVHELYEKWFDADAATKQYSKDLEKTRQEDFGNSRSIEDTTARIKESTEALKEWQQYKDRQVQEGGSFWSALLLPGVHSDLATNLIHSHFAAGGDEHIVKQQKALRALRASGSGQAHQQAQTQIELNHALDGELRGREKILMDLAKQKSLNQEAQDYEKRQAQLAGNTVAGDFGDSERKLKDAVAQKEAEAELFNLRRDQTHELMGLYNAANNARLHGSALYEAQEKQAIAELEYQGISADRARAAVGAKFHAEKIQRLQDELYATQEIQARAAAAGLTGIGKTQAEGVIADANIRGDKHLSGKAKDARVAAADQTTQQQILEQQRQFSSDIDAIADQSASHQISGFARIHAEETKQLSDLQKKFDATYGHMDRNAEGAEPIYQKGLAELNHGKSAISEGASDKTNELAQHNADETAQIEAEANIRSLSAEKQKTAAIEAEYQERKRKYQEELDQKQILQDDFDRRMAAAAEERDAEMVAAAKAAREKMASQFDSVFRGLDHPLQELQRLGEKAASEAAASMVQKYQQRHGGAPEGNQEGMGGVFGSIFGLHKGHGGNRDLAAEMGGHSHATSTSSIFTVTSATIHVGAAQIAFGGGTGAGGGGGSFGGGLFSSSGGSFAGGSFFPTGSYGTVGGAGSTGAPEAAAHTSGGVMPSQGSGVGGVLNDLQQGMSLTGSAKGLFGGKGSSNTSGLETTDKDVGNGTLNADGSYTSAGGGGMLQGGGFGANAMGAAGGVLGMYGAVKGNGGVGGALGGAMSGMQLGMALGGPVGAAVGAAAGAIVGAIGFGGREKARVYDLKQVRPRIQSDQLAYNTGSMDYMSAYSDIQALDEEAKKTTRAMGMTGKSYYVDSIRPEIRDAIQKFNSEEKAGRSQYTATAAQFAMGTDFVPSTGYGLIHEGERITPSDDNRQITRSLRSAAGITELHKQYQTAMQRGSGSSRPAPAGETHLHFYAHDSKTAMQFFMANKHVVRKALNASYAENSGGADA